MPDAKKPTKREVKKAIAVIAADEPITGARNVLEAAGCTSLVIGGITPCGNLFLLAQPTTPQLRGLLRETISQQAAEQRPRKAVRDA